MIEPITHVRISKEALDLMIEQQKEQREKERQKRVSDFIDRAFAEAEAQLEQERFNEAVELAKKILLAQRELTNEDPNKNEALNQLKEIAKHSNAEIAITNAIKLGYITNNGTTLKWNDSKAKLAKFTELLCCPSAVRKFQYPNAKLCKIFSESRLDKARTQTYSNKNYDNPYPDIDGLFLVHTK